MNKELATYQVSLKLLLRKDDSFLFLKDTFKSFLDLPGGRINADEFSIPLKEILKREVEEELGKDIAYTIHEPLFQFRRFHQALQVPVLLTVYEGTYESGEIALSDEHEGYEWAPLSALNLEQRKFYCQEEIDTMTNYFNSIKNS